MGQRHFPDEHIDVTYEDAFSTPEKWLRRIYSFLDVDYYPSQSSLAITHTRTRLCDAIENPGAVAEALRGSLWDGWLNVSSTTGAIVATNSTQQPVAAVAWTQQPVAAAAWRKYS